MQRPAFLANLQGSAKSLKLLEAGVGIEPAYTALQAAEVARQIKHFGQFHFRQYTRKSV